MTPGPVEVGKEYDNSQRIGPMKTTLRYQVDEYEPGRHLSLRSRSALMSAHDEMPDQSTAS